MKFANRRIIAGMALAIVLAAFVRSSGVSAQAATSGRLRLVHAVPGAPAVDVSIDSVTAVHGLVYGTATRYLNVTSGDHAVLVSAGGKKVLQSKVTVGPDPLQGVTLVLQGTASAIATAVYEDDLGPVALGNIRMNAIHAIKDAPALDVLRSDGSPLIQGLKYGAPYGGFDIPVASISAVIVPAGGDVKGALLTTGPLPLVAGTLDVLIALGTTTGAEKPSYLLVSAPTGVDKPAANVFVRFVNAAPTGKAVDIYASDKLIVPALGFGTATPHVALDAAQGNNITIRDAGSDAKSNPLATFDLAGPAALTGGGAGTLALTAKDDGTLALQLATDNIASPDPKVGRLNLVNAAGGAATLKLGTQVLVSNAPKATAADIPPGNYAFTVTVDNPAIQFSDTLPVSGGVLYDIIVAGNAQTNNLIIAATGLNEQPSSAPGNNVVVVAQANTPTAAATQAAQPVSQSPATEQAPATQPAAANTAPTASPTATEVPQATEAATQPAVTSPDLVTDTPVPAPTTPGITGVVDVNEGVNLKIREYPRTDARTLALVPKDGNLDVLGVRGPVISATPNIAPTNGPTPTLSSTDVSIDQVWLYVTWTVPSGGTVTGWVNAQFVQLTRNGKRVSNITDIFTFKEVAATTPGEVNSGAVTPIAQLTSLIGTVTVNEGSNLQLRRTPDINGESMALLPANAQVEIIELIALNPQGTPIAGTFTPTPQNGASTPATLGPGTVIWLFVRYHTDNGGAIDGWVNSAYLKLSKNGRKVDLAKDVPIAKQIDRGFLEGNALAPTVPPPPGVIATVNKVNQGANLQLRRNPDATSESLGLIPASTELQVQGRNGDGNWLEVKFNDQVGWVNSQFVTLTKNGKKYKVEDLTNVSGQPNTIGTVTPGPSPTPTSNATPQP